MAAESACVWTWEAQQAPSSLFPPGGAAANPRANPLIHAALLHP